MEAMLQHLLKSNETSHHGSWGERYLWGTSKDGELPHIIRKMLAQGRLVTYCGKAL
jgi:hypothetical protein